MRLASDVEPRRLDQDPSMAARPRRILVGYDGSEAAQHALDVASDLMSYGSTIAVLGTADGHGDAADLLEQARGRLLRRQVSALYLEAVGDPVEHVLAAVDQLGADLVVIGREGAVDEELVRRLPCSVLVVVEQRFVTARSGPARVRNGRARRGWRGRAFA
jgi:nucleotide-binding universal stress UspA family protein